MAVRALCLCDGYGGFELGLREHGVRTVARVERDSFAASVLVARMEEARLDQAPVWDDLETFDGAAWRGRVDLVTAGFPCQPFSAAGQRRGVDDDRWLWPAIGRIIGDVGPRCVFLENVPGLVQHGLPHVLADLADLGFDAEWGLLAASDVGAPHRRQRFWLAAVAHDDDLGREGVGWLQRGLGSRGVVDRPGGADVGNARGARRPEVTGGASRDEGTDGRRARRGDVADGAGQDVADPAGVDEREPHHAERTEPRQRTRADTGWSGFPPRPDDLDGWDRWIAEGGPKPSVRRSVDGATGQLVRPDHLADRLHLLGNGLVPQVAAEAFTQLLQRMTQP